MKAINGTFTDDFGASLLRRTKFNIHKNKQDIIYTGAENLFAVLLTDGFS
jgi:hypothetical protein